MRIIKSIYKKIYKRITAGVLTAAMILSLPEIAQGARIDNKITIHEETADNVTLGNSFVTLTVSKKNGGYTLKTSEGDVLTKTDNNKRLLYAPDGDATSFATVRIDDTDYIYGNENEGRFITKPHIADGNTVVSTYAVTDKNVSVTQTIRLLMDSSDDKLGAIQITYSVSNTASGEAEESSVKAGLRMVLDTCLGAQDYAVYEMAENGVNGTYKQYTKAVEFGKSDIAAEFRALDNNYAPRVAAYGYPDDASGKPDSMIFGHWYDMASYMWKYDVDGNLSLVDNSNPYKTADSAVALFWDEKTIEAGGRSDYSFFYGISANNNVAENDTMQMTVRPDKDRFVLEDMSQGERAAYVDNILNLQVKLGNTLPASVFRANVAVKLMVDEEYLQIDYNDVKDEAGNELAVETNEGKDLIHITNFEVGQTKFINWKVHVKKLPPSIRYIKYALQVYDYSSDDNGNDYTYLESMPLCSADGNILAPGYTGKKPAVGILSSTPEYLYYKGNRSFVVRGEGFEILSSDMTNWELHMKNMATGDETVIDSSRIKFNSDDTAMIINFIDEMPVGEYQFIIIPGATLTDENVGLPERITSNAMKVIVSDDRNLVNPPIGGIAIKKTGKYDKAVYTIETFSDPSLMDGLTEDYLLTLTGNLYRTNVDGEYTTPIVGEAEEEDIIINRIMTYRGSEFTVDYTYDKHTKKQNGVQIRMKGDAGVIGGSSNVWIGESVIKFDNGKEYSLDPKLTKKGDAKANKVCVKQEGFSGIGAVKKIAGFLISLNDGSFNRRVKESSKSKDKKTLADYNNTISFGGKLNLSFLTFKQDNKSMTRTFSGINVEDVRYGEKDDGSKGHIGIKADASNVGLPSFINPLPADISGGLTINTIDYPYLVNVRGSLWLATFSSNFELEVIGSKKHGVPVPNVMRLEVGGITPGVPIVPIPPVVYLTGGYGDIRGLYSLFYPGEDPSNVPDTTVKLAGQVSIVDVMSGMLGISIGTRHASLYGERLNIAGVPILKSVSGDFTWYPEISFGVTAKLKVMDYIQGTLSAKVLMKGEKAPNLDMFGNCKIVLGRGLTVAGVTVGGDKEKLYGAFETLGTKMSFTMPWSTMSADSFIELGNTVKPVDDFVGDAIEDVSQGVDDVKEMLTTGISNTKKIGEVDGDVNAKAQMAENTGENGQSGTNGVYYSDPEGNPDIKVDEDGRLRILNPGLNPADKWVKVYYDLKDGNTELAPEDVKAAIDGRARTLIPLHVDETATEDTPVDEIKECDNAATANMMIGSETYKDKEGNEQTRNYILLSFKESELRGKSELSVYSDKATVSYAELFNIGAIPEINEITASYNEGGNGKLKVVDANLNTDGKAVDCIKSIYLGTADNKYEYKLLGDDGKEFALADSTMLITVPDYVPGGEYYVTEVIDGTSDGADIHEERTATYKVLYKNPKAPEGNISDVTTSFAGDSSINVSMKGFDPDTMDGVYVEAYEVDENGNPVKDEVDVEDLLAGLNGEDGSQTDGGSNPEDTQLTDEQKQELAEGAEKASHVVSAYVPKANITTTGDSSSFTYTVNPDKENGTYYKVKVYPYKSFAAASGEEQGEQAAAGANDVALGIMAGSGAPVKVLYPSPANVTIGLTGGYVEEDAVLYDNGTDENNEDVEQLTYKNKVYTSIPDTGISVNISSDIPVSAKVYIDDQEVAGSETTTYETALPAVAICDASGNTASGNPVTDGEHVIRVVAKTAAGDTSVAEESVKLDTSGPILQVFSPQVGDTVKNGKINISGMTTDGAGLDIEVDGHAVAYDAASYVGGAFNLNVDIPEETSDLLSHEVKITVKDKYDRTNEYSVNVDDNRFRNITGVYLTVDGKKVNEGDRVYTDDKKNVDVALWAVMSDGSGNSEGAAEGQNGHEDTAAMQLPSDMVEFENISDDSSDDIKIDDDGKVTITGEGTLAVSARLYLTEDFCYQSNVVLDSYNERMKTADAVAPLFAYTDTYPVYTEDNPEIINVTSGDKLTLSAATSFENEADKGNVTIEWFGRNDAADEDAAGYTMIGEGESIEVAPVEDTTYFAVASNTIRTTGITTASAYGGYKKVHVRHNITADDITCEGTVEEQSDGITYYAGDMITLKAADGESYIGEYGKDGTIEWKNEIVKTNLVGGEQSFTLVLKDKKGHESRPITYTVNIKNIINVEISYDGEEVEGIEGNVKAFADSAVATVDISNFDKASGVENVAYELTNKSGTITRDVMMSSGSASFDIELKQQGINTIKILTKDAQGMVIDEYTYTSSAVIYKVPECDISVGSSYTYNGLAISVTDDMISTGGSTGVRSITASVSGEEKYSDDMPVTVGDYDIKLEVGRDDVQYYTAAKVVKAVTITKAPQVITFANDNYTPEAGETITVNAGGICIADYQDISVSSNNTDVAVIDDDNLRYDANSRTITIPVKALTAGTAVITVEVPGDDNYQDAVKTCGVNVVPAESDDHPYKLVGTRSADGWYTSDVMLKPSEGYTVSASEDGEFKDSYSITGEGTERNPKTLYFMNSYGKVHPIDIDTVNIDTSLPEGEIKAGESGWRKFLNTITFGLFFKENVVVEAEADDAVSGIDRILYYKSSAAMTIDQLKELGDNDWSEDSIKIEPDSKAVVYARITDKAGNELIISTDGIIADKTPALISIESEDLGGWAVDHQAAVSVSVSDALAGISDDNISYTIDGGTALGGAKSFRIENLEDGEHNIVINAVDNAGNTSKKTFSLRQDRVLPAVTLSEDKDAKKLIVNCNTGVSGIANVVMLYDGNEQDITDTYEDGISITYNGKYEVRLTSNAGITVNKTIDITDLIDNTEPSPKPVPTIQVTTATPISIPTATTGADPSATPISIPTATPISAPTAIPTATPDATPEPVLPTIIRQPSDVSLTYGYKAGSTLNTEAQMQIDPTEYTLSYQWYIADNNVPENGTEIEGAISSTYSIPEGKSAGTEEYYYCKVTAARKDGSQVTARTTDCVAVRVSKLDVTVTAKDQTVAVGGQPDTTVAAAVLDDALNGHSLGGIRITADSTENAGVGLLTPGEAKIVDGSGNDVTGNYSIDYRTGTLVVQGSVVYVKQNMDGTWPADPSGMESEVRPGRGSSYEVTEGIAGKYSAEHYILKGYGTTYSTAGNCTGSYAGQTIALGDGVNVVYMYYELENLRLNFYEDTAGTTVWKTVNLRYGSRLSDYSTDAWRMADKTNDTFAGWVTEPNIVVDCYNNKDGSLNPVLTGKLADWSGTITSDISVYPIWIHDRLAVEIDTVADDVVLAPEQSRKFTVNLDEKIKMGYLINASRPGYELAGWYTQGGVLWNGENWKNLEYIATDSEWDNKAETVGWGVTPEFCNKDAEGKDYIQTESDRRYNYYTVTLTARWRPVSAELEYDAGEYGSFSVTDENKYSLNDSFVISSLKPDVTDDGKIFIGWKIGDEETLHSPGETFLFNNWKYVKDGRITLKAQYIDKLMSAITFDSNGGTAVAPIAITDGTQIEQAPVTSRMGYTFDGWYDGDSKVVFPYTASDSKELKAHWTINSYTITFDSAGGTKTDPITQAYGSVITPPSEPTKAHYAFEGWHPALPDKMPGNNLTVTAGWTPAEYTISFNTDGGSAVDNIKSYYGLAVIVPADPVKEGYTFAGWLDAEGNIASIPSYMPDTNPSYKAKWKKNQQAPAVEALAVNANTVKITDPADDVEYIIVIAGQAPSDNDWNAAKRISGGEVSWDNLLPLTGYDVWARRYGADDKMASEAAMTTVTTTKEEQAAPPAPMAKEIGPNAISITLVTEGEEYALVPSGEEITDSTEWRTPDGNGEIKWLGLTANTSYDVYARLKGNDKQNPSKASDKTVVQTPKYTPEVTPPVQNVITYDGGLHVLAKAGKTSGGKLQYRLGDSGEYSDTVPQAVLAGTYNLWYKVKGNKSYYDTEEAYITVIIGKRSATASAGNKELTYGETYVQTDSDYEVTGLVEGDIPAVTLSVDNNTNKINIVVTVWHDGVDMTDNYYITRNFGILTVIPAELTVAADDKEKTMGANDPELTYTVSGLAGNDKKEDVLTGTLTRENGETVGIYEIGKGSLSVTEQYAALYGIKFTPGKLTIKASPTPVPTATPEPTRVPATATPKVTDKPTAAPASATPNATDKPTAAPASATPKATDKPTTAPASATPKATDKPTTAPASATPNVTDKPTVAPASATPNATDKPTVAPEAATPTPEATNNTPVGKGTKLTAGKAEFIVTSSNVNKPEVAYSKYTGASKKVSVPARITSGGVKYTVTSIRGKAFAGNAKLKTIVIPKTVTAFGREAFANITSLKSITIKCATLKAKGIKAKAFAGIGNKAVIRVPKGYKNTYKKLFRKKGLNRRVKVK